MLAGRQLQDRGAMLPIALRCCSSDFASADSTPPSIMLLPEAGMELQQRGALMWTSVSTTALLLRLHQHSSCRAVLLPLTVICLVHCAAVNPSLSPPAACCSAPAASCSAPHDDEAEGFLLQHCWQLKLSSPHEL